MTSTSVVESSDRTATLILVNDFMSIVIPFKTLIKCFEYFYLSDLIPRKESKALSIISVRRLITGLSLTIKLAETL